MIVHTYLVWLGSSPGSETPILSQRRDSEDIVSHKGCLTVYSLLGVPNILDQRTLFYCSTRGSKLFILRGEVIEGRPLA